MEVIYKKEYLLSHVGGDGVNPQSNTIIDSNRVEVDKSALTKRKAHWDWAQIISRILGFDNRQYAAALAENITITNNTVDGRGSTLQCIFCMDGRLDNIIVSNNILGTDGEHLITLSGVKSGIFKDNFDFDGNRVPAVLESLRIAGDIHIISFLDADDDYGECIGYFEDWRRKPFRKEGHTYLLDFDLKGFLSESLTAIPAKGSAKELLPLIRELALKYGNILTKQEGRKMDVSAEGRALLLQAEGKENRIYLDSAGHETIGIGHKLTREERNTRLIMIGKTMVNLDKDVLTDAEIYQLLKQDIDVRVNNLNKLLRDNVITLAQHQFDALFDFYFNIGKTQFLGSSVWERVKAGNFEGVPEAMAWWNKKTANGVKVVSKGLAARRSRAGLMWQGFGLVNDTGPTHYRSNSSPDTKEDLDRRLNPAENPADGMPINSPVGRTPLPARNNAPDSATNYYTGEVEYHNKPTDSSTIRNLYYTLATSVVTIVLSHLDMPEVVQEQISTTAASVIGMALTGFFAYRARNGRLTAKKQFKPEV